MKIKTDSGLVIDIKEKNLIVKNKRLYNTETKCYEGVDGDYAKFTHTKGIQPILISGPIDGYTNGSNVKLRRSELCTNAKDVKIEHIYGVELIEDEILIKSDIVYTD